MLKLKIFSESIELQASQVANQYPFVATITYAGKLSDGYVGGTESIDGGPYRVLINADLLRKKIKSLAGKSVLVADDLQSHKQNYKIGTFKQAWVEAVTLPDGQTVLAAKASGLIEETEDNQEIVERIIDDARAERLGFSYDIKDVKFDLKASTDSSGDQYVEVSDFEWRGATILRRDAAAYEETRLAASKTTPRKDEDEMTPKDIQDAITPLLSPLQTSIASIQSDVANLKAETANLKAAAGTPPKDKKEDSQSMTAKDFASAIATAVAEAMKPVVEGQTKVMEAVSNKKDETNNGGGIRRSVAFTDVFASKWHLGKKPDLNTVDGCLQQIEEIQANEAMPKDRRLRMLSELGAEKRRLMREANVNGGAN